MSSHKERGVMEGGGDSCVLGESVLNVLMAEGEACTSDTYTTVPPPAVGGGGGWAF